MTTGTCMRLIFVHIAINSDYKVIQVFCFHMFHTQPVHIGLSFVDHYCKVGVDHEENRIDPEESGWLFLV